MHSLRLHLKQAFTGLVHALAARLFHHKCHGCTLVQELQIAARVLATISGITKDSTVQERPMNVTHHASHVTMCVPLLALIVASFETFQVVLESVVPSLRVGLIARIHIAALWNR